MNEEITVSACRCASRARPRPSLAEGGLVDPSVDTIEVSCTPANIPNEFVIDITDMQPHDVIRLADVPMPKGVTALGDPDMPVVTILITAAAEAEADEAEAAEGDAEARRSRRAAAE